MRAAVSAVEWVYFPQLTHKTPTWFTSSDSQQQKNELYTLSLRWLQQKQSNEPQFLEAEIIRANSMDLLNT